MKKTIAAAAALAAVALTGCSSDDGTDPAAAAVTSEDSASTYEVGRENGLSDEQVEEVYTSMVRSEWPADFGSLPDEMIIETGQAACDALDNGASFFELVMKGVESGYEMEVISGFLGGSIATFCPEHTDKME